MSPRWRWLLVSCLSLLWVLSHAPLAVAPLPDLSQTQSATQPPRGVTRYGDYEVAEVRSPLDNRELLQIASPTVWDRSTPPENQVPVEIRASAIKAHLLRQYTNLVGAGAHPAAHSKTQSRSRTSH